MNKKPLYLQMFSIHGLVRSRNMELGRDADTGGQVLYVVELATALSRRPEIGSVDVVTRRIEDKTVSEDYAEPIETVTKKCRIVRVPFGGKKYMRKELLWPYLEECVDKVIKFNKQQNKIPDLFHGHYADAGYVCMRLSEIFDRPFVFTGHSLGRPKRQRLMENGMKEEEIVKKYKIDQRISVEEDILSHVDHVVTSTSHEIEEQYGMYEVGNEPEYSVIPPGLNLDKFYPYYKESQNDLKLYARASVREELNRFFTHPDRPLVLSLCRPDKRKNISGLIDAYGRDSELQTMANIAIFAGIRKDISRKEENERQVLTEMLLHMDKYDLYGSMAIPKQHDFDFEVPELYRMAAESRGVFVNAALTEPFGLTLIEASACGVPVIATANGGPVDIVRNLDNGFLVDVTDPEKISKAIKKVLSQHEIWKRCSKNGIVNVQKHYTWTAHVDRYLELLKSVTSRPPASTTSVSIEKGKSFGNRLIELRAFLITDIDDTLIASSNAEPEMLIDFLQKHYDRLGFGVATGRTVSSAREHLKEHGLPVPDVLITSVGSEIYYGNRDRFDRGWHNHISHRWQPDKIKSVLEAIPFLTLQEEEVQRQFKISYYMEPGKDRLAAIHRELTRNRCRYNLIYSQNVFLDILPYRASKGKAIRYLSYKWEIPLSRIVVCGDSGNDEEMLRGDTMGIVVGNYSPELEKLKGQKKIYFANEEYCQGIMEGIRHYNMDRWLPAGEETT